MFVLQWCDSLNYFKFFSILTGIKYSKNIAINMFNPKSIERVEKDGKEDKRRERQKEEVWRR